MSWEKRISLCIELLEETLDVSLEENKEDLMISLKVIQQYLSEDFNDLSEEEKENCSISLLNSTIKDCLIPLEEKKESIYPLEPLYMTKEDAEKKLKEEYMRLLKEDSSEIASMNINDWMNQNRIYLVEKEDDRLISSSCLQENKNE